MNRAAIVTIYDPKPNYGNRLQNYAAQEILAKEGFETVTISFEKRVLTGEMKLKYWLQKMTAYRLPGDSTFWRIEPPKFISFERFNKKFIRTVHVDSIEEVDKNADFYLIGSDQVWNPSWYNDCPMKKDMYFLTFAPSKKKVCMAPSFGISELPDEWVDYFREQLNTFPMLSVREQAGAELIYKLTGRTAEVVIDPTLMLDEEEWLKIAQKPRKIACSKPYILTYFLGGRTAEQERYINHIAKEYGLEVYHLLDRSEPLLYAASPEEFLYLMKCAALLFTDSFHVCVFSFLFKRPFLVYQRNGNENQIFSRIESLLETLHLQRKYADSGMENDLFECDYTEGQLRLQKERAKALSFLRKSMGLEDAKIKIERTQT